MGSTPVPPEWTAYLRKHNALVQFTADVCFAAESAGVAWFVENPASRESGVARWDAMAERCLMWHMPALVSVAEETGAREVCHFAPLVKRALSFLPCVSRT